MMTLKYLKLFSLGWALTPSAVDKRHEKRVSFEQSAETHRELNFPRSRH